ncbi:CLUMA_CG008385, isoform A [Clunio marinus]|uniref:CLUMA_CG008385, isoform A n=1 Tax=Clunio marinus TaxID=568069 RepID=A0A1J1I3M2_9DIPT|nr:CLUMA_CG008385, isoform A [Clunio marinus]
MQKRTKNQQHQNMQGTDYENIMTCDVGELRDMTAKLTVVIDIHRKLQDNYLTISKLLPDNFLFST